MKKINFAIHKNKSHVNNNIEFLNHNKNLKTRDLKDSIYNQFKKRFQKKEIIHNKLNSSNLNQNTILSNSLPYHYILEDLIKYLETKINSSLYEDINNYVNKRINNYYLENLENSYKTNSKKVKINLNKRRNTEINIFPEPKSFLNFNILENNKINTYHNNCLNKNNYIKTNESIKSKKENLFKKLLISNDCINKKINLLRNKKKKKIPENCKIYNIENNFYTINNNSKQNQDTQISFDNYYNGSSENIRNFHDISYDYNKNKFIKKKIGINAYNKLKPRNTNNLRLNKDKIENNLRKIGIYNKKSINFSNKKTIKSKSKSKSIRSVENKKRHKINKIKIDTIVNNKDKLFNKLKKEKTNLINKTFNNIENKNRKNISNNKKKNSQNITINSINLNLGKKQFTNKKPLINKKLINKLKINLLKNTKFYNQANKLQKKPYNLKKLSIFSELSTNKNINKNNFINKSLLTKNSNIKLNNSNIKKAKSYRLTNSNNKSVSSQKHKSNGKIYNKNNITKLDKNNFLNIVNNITNKKNINDKKYIHISSIEINNIIKSNEKKDDNDNDNKEILESNHKFQNIDMENDELMKKIKNSIDDNLKVMLNFSYENFLSKESDRESKDFNSNFNEKV